MVENILLLVNVVFFIKLHFFKLFQIIFNGQVNIVFSFHSEAHRFINQNEFIVVTKTLQEKSVQLSFELLLSADAGERAINA